MKQKLKLATARNGAYKSSFAANKYMYILLAPAVICVLIFGYAPLSGLLIAFKDYDTLLGFAKSPWVGLENIKNIFFSEYTTDSFNDNINQNIYLYSRINICMILIPRI